MMSNNDMEIERKFLVKKLPDNLDSYKYHIISQAYILTAPVLRIRQLDDEYILTYKSAGMMARKEIEMPLDKMAFFKLLAKTEGLVISKKRYLIPDNMGHTIELDIFDGDLKGLIMAEVEFSDEKEANEYMPPEWLGQDVTNNPAFHNSTMSKLNEDERIRFLQSL